MTRSFSLLTKTYRGDASLFGELCESIDEHMPEIEHYVLVDGGDFPLFAEFSGDRRHIIDCSRELPRFKELDVFGRRIWWRFPHRIVRGWIFQQIARLHFASRLDCDAVVSVDSDAVFVRPIDPHQVFDGKRIRFFKVPDRPSGPAAESPKWHDAASDALGLPKVGYTGHDYITTTLVWSPAIVRDLLEHISDLWNRPWHDVLIRPFRFSECVLYGVYASFVAKDIEAHLSPTQQTMCHISWGYDLELRAERLRFARDIADHQCAIVVQSNLGLDRSTRNEIIELVRDQVRAKAA
ncbi:DUF6492 family protein [Erythrobacter sp. THAF29]|uniref:DUF6492 family protein n=1 Tax=Erythrobacter sp. THAF29 TaxID=2587851 RepID=UPI001268822B|nr:DUF6492 family protein [Erythrobacter sp. THAF29]QFT75971.1 hypothetical protein FIU90_00310 [Erythrobacter sp. THAF29]